MAKTNIPSEIKQAWEILAEINDMLGQLISWTAGEANERTNALHLKWQALCSETKSAVSMEFYNRCQDILKECNSFRTDIVNKAMAFADKAQSRGPVISELAGENKETKALMEEILKLWNEVEHPRLVFLYEKTAGLESRIMDMIEFAMEPLETTK